MVGEPHHITQRGNAQQTVFFSDQDRTTYLNLLRVYSARYHLHIWGYCLMNNHVHIIAVPDYPDSLWRAVGRTHNDYSRYANAKRAITGHLWQARFFSCPLDGHHRWAALAYVEQNPVRAGLVDNAAAWPWSSARSHLASTHDHLDKHPWAAIFTPARWAEVLRTTIADEETAERLRSATRTGRPLQGQSPPSLNSLLQRHSTPRDV